MVDGHHGKILMEERIKNQYLDIIYGEDDFLKNLPYAKKLASFIFNEILKLSNKENKDEKLLFLDLGCGKGLQSLAFSDYFDISGLDRSKDAKNLFQRQKKIIDLRVTDFEKDRYPFNDNTFDIIFSKSVIEHVLNTDHFLNESKRMLKEGGKIIVMCPAWETQSKNFYDDYTHVRPFTTHGLEAALRACGFKEVEVSNFYQLPFVWKFPVLKLICYIISFLPDRFKWYNNKRSKPNKLIRFSKETMLLGIGTR